MRKVISIVCSVVLCMSIVLASVGQVSALENADVANREEQISALFDEMTENLALSLLNEAIADESSVSSQAAVQEDLADIDEQAENMFDQLVRQLAEREGVTEQLKANNQMLWVKKMNSIRNRAEEIVNHELIYS